MINSRSLTRPYTPPQEVDTLGLQAFQDDVVRNLRMLDDANITQHRQIGELQDRLNRMEVMLTWIGTHRPDAIIDFNTTQDVINRLDNGSEVMTEKMEI